MEEGKRANSEGGLRTRFSDPVISALTVLLVFMLFIAEPLQATGFRTFALVDFISALVLIGGIFFLSTSPIPVVAALVALAMAGWAAVSRLTEPSAVDVYLKAGAWLILGSVLGGVVGCIVFSPGRVTYHRIVGAILVYLSIAVTFVSLFTIIGSLVPDAFFRIAF